MKNDLNLLFLETREFVSEEIEHQRVSNWVVGNGAKYSANILLPDSRIFRERPI